MSCVQMFMNRCVYWPAGVYVHVQTCTHVNVQRGIGKQWECICVSMQVCTHVQICMCECIQKGVQHRGDRSPQPEVLRIEFPSSAVWRQGAGTEGLPGFLMPGTFAKDPDGRQGFRARRLMGEGLHLLPGSGML